MVTNNRDVEFSPTQCKMARAGLGLGVRDLAALADVAPATLVRFEAGGGLHHRSIRAIYDALMEEGAVFFIANDGGDGIVIRGGDNGQ